MAGARVVRISTSLGRGIAALLVAAILAGAWTSAGWLGLDLVAALIFYRLLGGGR